LQRSAKLKVAATILVAVGVAETALFAYAIWRHENFSGGSLFYVYAGYKLLKGSARAYKFVTNGLLMFLSLMVTAILSIIAWSVYFLSTNGLSFAFKPGGLELATVAAYFVLIPVLIALLYHPETRSEFGIAQTGTAVRTLYMGLPRASAVIAIGLVLMGILLGPHLMTNPFRVVASALRSDDGVAQKLGKIDSLTLLDVGEGNWTFNTRIRAKGSKGIGFYHVDVAPTGSVKLDAYAYEGVPEDMFIPRVQEGPSVAEASTDGSVIGEVAILLSTSFEIAPGETATTVRPFVQSGQMPWARDKRARSGQMAINAIPEGNPGKLEYFHKSVNTALLSSRLDDRYVPFRVEGFRRVELEFWRLSTSNPSMTHNCLGSLQVDYRLDGGEWQSKMNYCGSHKTNPPEWKRSKLDFNTSGHKELEIRFEYEYPPERRVDKTVVYLIDDLQVRGYR
jgi:hypothetical protein